jgi:hypothetical protein
MHRLSLKEGRLLRKVQNRKTICRTAAFIVNFGKTISRQHQNLTVFNVKNAENGCMNPLQFMGCFVIHEERIRREKITRKRETVKRSAELSDPHLREKCRKCCLSFALHL